MYISRDGFTKKLADADAQLHNFLDLHVVKYKSCHKMMAICILSCIFMHAEGVLQDDS